MYQTTVSNPGYPYTFVRTIKMIQFNDEPFDKERGGSNEPTLEMLINTGYFFILIPNNAKTETMPRQGRL